MLIFDIAIAGNIEAKLVIIVEKTKIIMIDKEFISLGISSKKYISSGNISILNKLDNKILTSSILIENKIPKTVPAIVANNPIVNPVKKKDLTTDVLISLVPILY